MAGDITTANAMHRSSPSRSSLSPTIRCLSRFLLVAGLLFASCDSQGDGKVSDAPAPESSGRAVVDVDEVILSDVEYRFSLAGEVFAAGTVQVYPDTSGLLTRVLVNPGDRVRYDQILGWVDPSVPGMAYAENPVRSKTAGVVFSVPAVPGNKVSPQSLIAEIGILDDPEVKVKVPEGYLNRLRTGLRAEIRTRTGDRRPIAGTVVEISPIVDRISRTAEVTIRPDSAESLRPGQSASVELVLERRTGILKVPTAAVTVRKGGSGVFILREQTARWIPVDVGYTDDRGTEIEGNLNPGDRVIVAGIEEVSDGSPVRIVE